MESLIIDHLNKTQHRAIDKYIIGATDIEPLKPLYKHGIVHTSYGYLQGLMHKQKMNISWDLLFTGYPCHHLPDVTGIRCSCTSIEEKMKKDIVNQHMLPYINQHVHEAMKIDDTYISRNIDRLIAHPDLIIGNYPLLKICQAMKGRHVRPFVAAVYGMELSVEDKFTAAAILMDTVTCQQIMATENVSLNVFGSYGFAKEDVNYRIAMIEEGISQGLMITGKAKMFVRKNRRHFSLGVIKSVLGMQSYINSFADVD